MGSAQHRSWSHTRQHTFDACPRSLYFAYYPWGDPDQNRARFLRRVTKVEGLAGTIVHRMIVVGLKQLVRRGTYPLGLARNGALEYEQAVEESLRIAKIARSGKRPPDEGDCLFHHLYGVEDAAAEYRGAEIITRCLSTFEESPALEFLKGTNFDRWYPILTNTDNVPWFVADRKFGFKNAAGLRVYANYDLALHHGAEFHIVDWKTGTKGGAGLLTAKRQLAVYGLWAMAQGIGIEKIRIQAVWVQESEAWQPIALDLGDVELLVKQIEEQDGVERLATKPIANFDGEIERYEADREAFPAKPEPRRCSWCSYQAICKDARRAA